MRAHLLALPNVQTTRAYSLDGFCQATIKFAKILRMIGIETILYASEENEAPCDELVMMITKEEQETLLGQCPYQYASLGETAALWHLANTRAIKEIAKRKEPRDLLLSIGGQSQVNVATAHPDLMHVEYSIGYVGSCAPYRVYESHVWRHCSHGFQNQWEGKFFDAVIPYFFQPHEFPYRSSGEKEGFALYVGRLVPRKGLVIACQSAQAAGVPLKVVGHGDPALVTDGAEYLGCLTHEKVFDLMSRASVVLAPTMYVEPFGATAVEAQLCGTPVVSTGFGGFVETVEHGRTGFRCDVLQDFIDGLRAAPSLDSRYIRDRAVATYSLEAVAPQYARFFERLAWLWGEGWGTRRADTESTADERAA